MQVIGQTLTLRHLDLESSCPRESGQMSAISNLVNLESLKLLIEFEETWDWRTEYPEERELYNSIDDETIESCRKLKYLSLTNFREDLTQKGLRHIPKLENLEELVLSGCETDDTVLAGLKNLKAFDCFYSSEIKDNDVIGIIKRSPNLEKLSLHYTCNISHRVLHFAAKTIEQRRKKLHLITSCRNAKLLETPFMTITQKK